MIIEGEDYIPGRQPSYMSPHKEDYTRHFTVEKRVSMFVDDLETKSAAMLIPRFTNLVIAIRKEANALMTKTLQELKKQDLATFKRRTTIQQSWYSIQERIYHFREKMPASRRFDFDQLIEDIQKNAAMESYKFLPTFTITPKKSMRTEDELKREISELEQVRVGLNSEIGVLNAKNNNAQARRDRVTSKIDGLKWILNEPKDD